MDWIQALDVKIQAALIASVVTILGIILKDLAFQQLAENRESKKDEKNIYGRYAEPLAKSAESLFWRLNEVFNVKGRAHFLIRSDVVTDFEDYKYVSTLYRLASLLGWVYAIKKEQSYLKPTNSVSSNKISEALLSIESGLSDGPHVETERLKRIANLWGLEVSDEVTPKLSISLERVIKSNLKKNEVALATELNSDKLFDLCKECAELLCNELNCSMLSDEILSETQAQAARRFSIREAWIYRDWQVGIGELMITKSESDARDYDVIGYKEFEAMLKSDDDELSLWISRIENTFKDLDVALEDGQDVRVNQIRATFKAIAKLIIAINSSELKGSPYSQATIDAAEANIA